MMNILTPPLHDIGAIEYQPPPKQWCSGKIGLPPFGSPPMDTIAAEPTRAEIDALEGPTLIEFGTTWCGYCKAAQPDIAATLQAHPGLRHIKIEDGKGRRLGRTFGVKLWPTLILMAHGTELTRVVRPQGRSEIEGILQQV
jgi:thioredoxin 1